MLNRVQFTTTRHSYMQKSSYEKWRLPFQNPSFGNKKVLFNCINNPFDLINKVHKCLSDNLKKWRCSTSDAGYIVEILKPKKGKQDDALLALETFINETKLAKAEIINYPKQS